MSELFVKGVNFMGQLGIKNRKQNLSKFTTVPSLQNRKIKQIEAHFSHSYCLLADGQILNWGWVHDSLTTARTISIYKKYTKWAQLWQKYFFLNSTLAMRIGIDEPSLLNKALIETVKPLKISCGGSFLLCLTDEGTIYGVGENYKGQLGIGDDRFKHTFAIVQKPTKAKYISMAAGFQHSLLLAEDGSCFGAGRCNWKQYISINNPGEQSNTLLDFFRYPQRIMIPDEKIIKISAGFSHSLFLTSKGNVYATGLNNFGQCGKSSLNKTYEHKYEPLYIDLEQDEYVVEMASGKSHNLLLTNKGRLFGFGATQNFQLGKKIDMNIEVCTPIEIPIKLDENENIVKIKANFDRNAIITDKGKAYTWGGEDHSKIGGECYHEITKLNDLFDSNKKITDVALGFMHTMVAVEE